MKTIKQQKTKKPTKSTAESETPYSFDVAYKIIPFTTFTFQENTYTQTVYLCM